MFTINFTKRKDKNYRQKAEKYGQIYIFICIQQIQFSMFLYIVRVYKFSNLMYNRKLFYIIHIFSGKLYDFMVPFMKIEVYTFFFSLSFILYGILGVFLQIRKYISQNNMDFLACVFYLYFCTVPIHMPIVCKLCTNKILYNCTCNG